MVLVQYFDYNFCLSNLPYVVYYMMTLSDVTALIVINTKYFYQYASPLVLNHRPSSKLVLEILYSLWFQLLSHHDSHSTTYLQVINELGL